MKRETLKILINPYNMKSLELSTKDGSEFLTDRSENEIPIENGVPNFLVFEKTEGLNEKYREFYNKIYNYYDIADFFGNIVLKLLHIINKNIPENAELFEDEDIEVKEGYKVLETSIGTGRNMKYLPEKAFYYGLDISKGMLMKCRKNMTRWKREIELFQGNAEFLPFKEETFDSVFHVGGINFFNDRKRAIEEMIRVAKPGAKIAIADEMEKTIVKQYEKMPIAKKYYNLSKIDKSRLVAPVDLVPVDMKDIKVKEILKRFYILTLRKP